MEFIERKKREMEEVNDIPRRQVLFSRFLLNTEFYVKDTKRAQYLAKMTNFSENCDKITLEIPDSHIPIGIPLVISKFVGRYVLIEAIISDIQPRSAYVLDIQKIQFAKKSRTANRIFPSFEIVYANNFKMNRASMELDHYNIPAFVKITFEDYENRLRKNFDSIKIDVFKNGMSEKFFLSKHSGKTFYIRNTQQIQSYKMDNDEEFLNCEEEFLDDIQEMISTYRNEKIISEVIMPIIYINSSGDGSAIGYVHIQSKSRPIEYDEVMQIKLLTLEMVDRIRESNTLVYTQKAQILNFSMDGLKVRISDKDLQEQIQIINGFTMDIVFKKQMPINVSVLVRNIVRDSNGDLLVGMEIDGFRKGDKERFAHNLKILSTPMRN
jgi:hypothetical protein